MDSFPLILILLPIFREPLFPIQGWSSDISAHKNKSFYFKIYPLQRPKSVDQITQKPKRGPIAGVNILTAVTAVTIITSPTFQCCVLIMVDAAVMIQGATYVSGCCDLAFLSVSEIMAAAIFQVLLLDNGQGGPSLSKILLFQMFCHHLFKCVVCKTTFGYFKYPNLQPWKILNLSHVCNRQNSQ